MGIDILAEKDAVFRTPGLTDKQYHQLMHTLDHIYAEYKGKINEKVTGDRMKTLTGLYAFLSAKKNMFREETPFLDRFIAVISLLFRSSPTIMSRVSLYYINRYITLHSSICTKKEVDAIVTRCILRAFRDLAESQDDMKGFDQFVTAKLHYGKAQKVALHNELDRIGTWGEAKIDPNSAWMPRAGLTIFISNWNGRVVSWDIYCEAQIAADRALAEGKDIGTSGSFHVKINNRYAIDDCSQLLKNH